MAGVGHIVIGRNETELIVSDAKSEHQVDFPVAALLNTLILQRKKLRRKRKSPQEVQPIGPGAQSWVMGLRLESRPPKSQSSFLSTIHNSPSRLLFTF